jgi:hypothetical protein
VPKEWIALRDAAWRLATRLNIDPTTAEDIIRNAMESERVLVRGVPFGTASVVPRTIDKEERRSILRQQHPLTRSLSLFPQFSSAEIEWHSLLAYVPNLLPSRRSASNATIDAAIRKAYAQAGEDPPNVNKIIAPAQAILRERGFEASGRRIRRRAETDEFKNRRHKVQ